MKSVGVTEHEGEDAVVGRGVGLRGVQNETGCRVAQVVEGDGLGGDKKETGCKYEKGRSL